MSSEGECTETLTSSRSGAVDRHACFRGVSPNPASTTPSRTISAIEGHTLDFQTYTHQNSPLSWGRPARPDRSLRGRGKANRGVQASNIAAKVRLSASCQLHGTIIRTFRSSCATLLCASRLPATFGISGEGQEDVSDVDFLRRI